MQGQPATVDGANCGQGDPGVRRRRLPHVLAAHQPVAREPLAPGGAGDAVESAGASAVSARSRWLTLRGSRALWRERSPPRSTRLSRPRWRGCSEATGPSRSRSGRPSGRRRPRCWRRSSGTVRAAHPTCPGTRRARRRAAGRGRAAGSPARDGLRDASSPALGGGRRAPGVLGADCAWRSSRPSSAMRTRWSVSGRPRRSPRPGLPVAGSWCPRRGPAPRRTR